MISFTPEGLDRYLAEDPGGPVVMLNLLRFVPDGGQELYMRYADGFAPLTPRYGLEVVYVGAAGSPLVADDAGSTWDMVAMIRYPSRRAFVDMVRDPEYLAIEHLRADALLDSVLQPTTDLPSG